MASIQPVRNIKRLSRLKSVKGSNVQRIRKITLYEKLILALVAKNGHDLSNDPNSYFCDFALSTDVDIGKDCKFNNIVFRYIDKDNTKNLIFVQIKHKQVDNQIDSKTLSTEVSKTRRHGGSGGMARDFNLQKYFISYLSVRDELTVTASEESKNGNIKYVIILTNAGLNVEELKKSGFSLEKAPDDIIKLFTLKTSSLNAQESNNFYQFNSISKDLYGILKKSSDLYRLARKLAQYVVWKNYREKYTLGIDETPVKHYHVALEKEVIKKSDKVLNASNKKQNLEDTSYFEAQLRDDLVENDEARSKENLEDTPYCEAQFRDDFLDNDKVGSKQELRDALFEVIRELDETKKSVTDGELKNYLKEVKFKVAPYFGKSKHCKISDLPSKWSTVTHQDIMDFLKSLVFIVNQPNENELEALFSTSARVTLLERTSLSQVLDKIENAGPELRKYIEKVLKIDQTRRYRKKWISGENILNFFQEYKQLINIPLVTFPMTLIYESKVLQCGKFNKSEKIETCINSFLSTDAQILCIITSATLLSSIKILQCLNAENDYRIEDRISISFDNLKSEPEREGIANAFQSESNNLLIIECKSEINEFYVKEFYEKLSVTIKRNRKKKIIFIMQDNEYSFLLKKLITDFQAGRQLLLENDSIDVKDFDPMDDPFKREIIVFQEQQEKLSLAKLTEISLWHFYVQYLDETRDEQDVIDIQTIINILNSNEIEVGSKPLGASSLDGAYVSLFEEINVRTFVNKLMSEKVDSNTNDIYIIDGISGSNEEEKFYKLIRYLEVTSGKTKVKSQMGDLGSHFKIQITDDNFNDEYFKRICCDHPEKRIFWIHAKDEKSKTKFFLQQFYNPKFYIKRKFKNIVIAKSIKELLTSERLSETFIFCSANSVQEIKDSLQFDSKSEEEQFEKNCENGRIKFFVSETDAEASFKEDCKDDSVVHLLKFDNNVIIWCKSEGSLKNLRKYIDYESETSPVEEEKLFKQIEGRKVLIIADDAGMGKSTTLTKLYESNYQSESLIKTHWVFRLNLKDHLQVVRDLELNDTDSDVLNVVIFFSKVDLKLSHNLAKYLLRVSLLGKKTKISKPLLFVFDGFDEVLEESDRAKIMSLLKFLKNKTSAKLWITTRRHFQHILEQEFSTFAVQFYPMNEDAKAEYIKQYLRDRCYLILSEQLFSETFTHNDKMQENVNIQLYTEKFLSKMKSIFTGNVPSFIGTPLQLYLMLEGSISHFKNWIENSKHKNPDFDCLGTNVLEVYEKFLERKYDVYFRKMGIKEILRQEQDKYIFNEYYKDFASSLILKSEPKDELEKFKNVVFFAGIIKSDGANAEFIDTTFRDYFAAKEFSQWIKYVPKSGNQEYLLKEILNKQDYQQIRIFINLELKNISETESFRDILKNYGVIFDKIYREEESLLLSDEGTVLHLAVKEGNKFIVSFLVNSLRGHAYILTKFLFHRTRCGNTALDEAVIHDDVDIVKLLLDVAEGISEDALQELLCFSDTLGHNVIDVAAKFSKNDEILEELLNRAINKLDLIMNERKKDSSLNIAIQRANEEFVKFIFKYFKHDRNSVEQLLLFCDDRGLNALCWAFIYKSSIAEYLLGIAKEMGDNNVILRKVLFPEEHPKTLKFAIETKKIHFVEMLLKAAEGVSDNNQSLKHLILNDETYATVLYSIRNIDFTDIIKLLLVTAAILDIKVFDQFISATNKDGRNIVHLILEHDLKDILVSLFEILEKCATKEYVNIQKAVLLRLFQERIAFIVGRND